MVFLIVLFLMQLFQLGWQFTYIRFNNVITAQKMKFSIKDFFSKCDQILCFLRIWSRLLKKSVMENFIFCAEHLVDLLKWSLVYHRFFSLFLLLLVFPQIRYFIFFPKNYTIVSIPRCPPSFIISLWYFPNKIFTVTSRLYWLSSIIDRKIAKISIWFLSFRRYSSWEFILSRNRIARLLL